MSNLNKIILIGRITDNPQQSNTTEGKIMAKYTLAVDRPKRADGSAGETDFIDIVSWGRTAEVASGHLKKGEMALVEGRVQVRSFDDADGRRKWVTEVVASNLVLLGDKQEKGANSVGAEDQRPKEFDLQDTGQVPAEEDIPF